MTCLLQCLTDQTSLLQWDKPDQHLRGFAHLFFLFKLFYLACLYKDFREEAVLYTPPAPPELTGTDHTLHPLPLPSPLALDCVYLGS